MSLTPAYYIIHELNIHHDGCSRSSSRQDSFPNNVKIGVMINSSNPFGLSYTLIAAPSLLSGYVSYLNSMQPPCNRITMNSSPLPSLQIYLLIDHYHPIAINDASSSDRFDDICTSVSLQSILCRCTYSIKHHIDEVFVD